MLLFYLNDLNPKETLNHCIYSWFWWGDEVSVGDVLIGVDWLFTVKHLSESPAKKYLLQTLLRSPEHNLYCPLLENLFFFIQAFRMSMIKLLRDCEYQDLMLYQAKQFWLHWEVWSYFALLKPWLGFVPLLCHGGQTGYSVLYCKFIIRNKKVRVRSPFPGGQY